MSTHQVKENESNKNGTVKEVVTKVSDGKNTEKTTKSEKSGDKHEAVLADVNNDSKKETK